VDAERLVFYAALMVLVAGALAALTFLVLVIWELESRER
jgi:hypothetical protein